MLARCLRDSKKWDLAWSNPDSLSGGRLNQMSLCEVFGWEDGPGYDRIVSLALRRPLPSDPSRQVRPLLFSQIPKATRSAIRRIIPSPHNHFGNPSSFFLAPPPGSEATTSIPPPQPFAILDVETERLAPLDARGRRWPHRPVPLNKKPGGPHHRPDRRPAPTPSPTGAADPRPRRSTASFGNTWRPTSPWPTVPIPWATGCPRMSRTSSEVTCAVASWPTGSLGPGALVVVTSSWSGFLAGEGGPVLRAQPATWPRPPPTWWTTSSPTSRSASSCSRFPSV